MRTALLVHRWFLACLVVLGFAALPVLAQVKVSLDLPEQPLADTIRAIAQKTGTNVLFDPALTNGKRAIPVKGQFTAEEALLRVLANTDLSIQKIQDGTISIIVRGKQSEVPAAIGVAQSSDRAVPQEGIIVTAQKREERLLDVPVAVSVVNTDRLAANNMLRFQEYYDKVPGLNLTPSTQSGQFLSIRGLSAGTGNPTVGITVDDVPYGSSTFLGGGAVIPDIDPADLARIEVLRGPQGTLYGASSIGGLIKFVTADPSTAGFSGRGQLTGDAAAHGNLGYGLRGAVNVPVSENAAFRASAFSRRDPGYISNPVLQRDDVNTANAFGGRLEGLWRPTDLVLVKLSALYQRLKGDGSSDSFPAVGDLQQTYIAGTGAYDRRVQAYSATVSASFDAVDLTSITGYNVNRFSDSFDGTFAFGPSTQAIFGVPGTPQFNTNSTDKLTQELRASGVIGNRVNWILGGFYTNEDSSYVQTRYASNPTTGAIVGTIQQLSFPTTFREHAVFGDITFKPLPALEIQVGGRQSWINQSYSSVFINRLGAVTTVPKVSVDTNAVTYLGTATYHFSRDVMAYVRASSGYRAGGPNVTVGVPAAPLAYDPDKSNDFEIGVKGQLIPRRLSIDAALFDIEWKDIQLTVRDPATVQSYTVNAAAARSRGAELSVELRPTDGLTISAWGAHADAVLTKPFPPTSIVQGAAGDRLPFGSKYSANVAVRQDMPITPGTKGYFGGTLGYIGDRLDRFGAATRVVFPSYTKLDLSAGIVYANLSLNVFVNNVADRRGQLAVGLAPNTRVFIQPRLIGVSLTQTF